jgi:hypothetical protein
VTICSYRQSLGEISLRPLFLRSRTFPTRNSRMRISQGSYPWPLAPGMFLMTACFCSSTCTSPSSSRFLRYFFSYSAPAFLIVDLMPLSGFPSILMRTSYDSMDILGLMSCRSLLETFRVFSCLRSIIDVGNSSSLLLCKSNTVMFGARSRFYMDSRKLYARLSISNFFD